ncbi:MAG: DUF1326 domain-containing protein [Solirubrobacterales bacterium]
MASNGKTAWRIVGEEVGNCNCSWGCPCQFNGNPTHGNCHALIAYEVREGSFGDTDLAGVRWASIVSWPGAIHEGDGTIQLVVDEAASAEQREAVEKLVSGDHGGGYFEIFASVLPHVRDPLTAPIEIETDRERRIASIKVGDFAQSTVEPIKNPVTGDEHRARIDLPDGFEYKQAEIGNTVHARVAGEAPLEFTLEGTYGQLNPIDWSNEA